MRTGLWADHLANALAGAAKIFASSAGLEWVLQAAFGAAAVVRKKPSELAEEVLSEV